MSLIDTLKRTGIKIENAFVTPERMTGEMDILDKLKQEHDDVLDLCERLIDTESSASRKSLLKQIKQALVPHSRAEEKIVYDAIISHREVDAKVDGEEGYCEHSLADKILSDLAKIQNAASPEFTAGAKVLKEMLEHHIKEEERNVWKDIKEYYDVDERIAMNRQFEMAKKKVRVA